MMVICGEIDMNWSFLKFWSRKKRNKGYQAQITSGPFVDVAEILRTDTLHLHVNSDDESIGY